MVESRPGVTYRKAGRVLRPGTIPPKGYRVIQLSVDGKAEMHYVHTLVLEAFIEPRPSPKHEARHVPDLDPGNNRASNLRWGTKSDNTNDSIVDGTHFRTATHACPRGHALIEPNLTPNIRAAGNRGCYACSLTHTWGKTRGLRPADPEWIYEANRRYAEIRHFGEPRRYSNTGREIRWTPSPE